MVFLDFFLTRFVFLSRNKKKTDLKPYTRLYPQVRLEDIWHKIGREGGPLIDLIPEGIIKNKKRMRFATKTIKLGNEE